MTTSSAREAVEDPPGSFGRGIAVGFAICAVLVHITLVGLTGNWSKLYEDLRTPLPVMTRLTISVPWQLGVPVAGAIAIGFLVLRRPRALAVYIAVAAVLAAAAACTWWFPNAPISELAGNIRAD